MAPIFCDALVIFGPLAKKQNWKIGMFHTQDGYLNGYLFSIIE